MADEISIDRMAYKSAITENDFFRSSSAKMHLSCTEEDLWWR